MFALAYSLDEQGTAQSPVHLVKRSLNLTMCTRCSLSLCKDGKFFLHSLLLSSRYITYTGRHAARLSYLNSSLGAPQEQPLCMRKLSTSHSLQKVGEDTTLRSNTQATFLPSLRVHGRERKRIKFSANATLPSGSVRSLNPFVFSPSLISLQYHLTIHTLLGMFCSRNK